MTLKLISIPFGLFLLGACEVVPAEPVAQFPSPEEQIARQIAALAAPNQDIQTARLRAEDNCYWYSYVGPVETTELPLMAAKGGHICAPAPEPVAAEVAG